MRARLILRDFQRGDIAAVHAYQSDPLYLQHTPWDARSEDEARDFVQMMIGWASEVPRTKFQLAISRNGIVIGNCGIRMIDRDAREAEYGCEIAPAAWGQGYAEEASRAILELGFRDLRLHRVFSNTIADNTAAIALALRLGMREEGRLREHVRIRDQWRDSVLLALLDREWKGGET